MAAMDFVASLKACAKQRDLHRGTGIHAEIVKLRLLENNCFVGSSLVNMYAKCGALPKAELVLSELPVRTVVAWNALIAGYVQKGKGMDALRCFGQMQSEGLHPDAVTFTCTLKACCCMGAADKGEYIHSEILRKGLLGKDVILGATLVDMYAKCGAFTKAAKVLDELPPYNVAAWNALIAGYIHWGCDDEALNCYYQLKEKGITPDRVTFISVLKACGNLKASNIGEHIHAEVLRHGFLEKDIVLGNTLVDMYAKCGALEKAAKVLGELCIRDVVSWSALIAGYAQQGRGEVVFDCLDRMQQEGLFPDTVTYISILKACSIVGAIDKGEHVHDDIVRQGLIGKDINLRNALLDMYAKCGKLAKSAAVLDELPIRDVVSWNALIAGYAEHKHCDRAVECLEHMMNEGTSPDTITFISVLKACGGKGAIKKGEQVHDRILQLGLLGIDIMLDTALVDMYAKCGELKKASDILDDIPIRDAITWSALIAGYIQHGLDEESITCFWQMKYEALYPTVEVCALILKACFSIGAMNMGELIYKEIIKQGFSLKDLGVGSSLVDAYANCGLLSKAVQVLDELPLRNVVLWNTLIAGYAQLDQTDEVLTCYDLMQLEGLCPDAITFTYVLKACGTIGAAHRGEQVHRKIVSQQLFGEDIVLGTALVEMYAKCGALAKAVQVLEKLPLRNVVTWSTAIAGYMELGQGEAALKCFDWMQSEGLSPDIITFVCTLKACSRVGAADKGQQVHDEIVRLGLLDKSVILGNTLVDMHVKCGALAKAVQVLKELPVRTVVSWNALIAGYTLEGQGEQALKFYELMQSEDIFPDIVTLTCCLKACGSIGAADKGEQIHNKILSVGLLVEDILGNTLVDMYAKCGALAKATSVLDELPVHTVVPWNALISGCAQQGQGGEALNHFRRMEGQGICPDNATFSSLLSACSHSGLLVEGQMCFLDGIAKHDIIPVIEHHSCIVDLFGRIGELDKAFAVIKKMPFCDHLPVWHALLGACQVCGNVELGKWAFDNVVHFDKNDAAAFILMTGIYVSAGMLEDARKIEAMRGK